MSWIRIIHITITQKRNIYFQVRDFNIAKTEADISYYAGYIGKITSVIFSFLESSTILVSYLLGRLCMIKNVAGSSFMLGRCLTSVLWGVVADRYGRKPVIVIGVVVV